MKHKFHKEIYNRPDTLFISTYSINVYSETEHEYVYNGCFPPGTKFYVISKKHSKDDYRNYSMIKINGEHYLTERIDLPNLNVHSYSNILVEIVYDKNKNETYYFKDSYPYSELIIDIIKRKITYDYALNNLAFASLNIDNNNIENLIYISDIKEIFKQDLFKTLTFRLINSYNKKNISKLFDKGYQNINKILIEYDSKCRPNNSNTNFKSSAKKCNISNSSFVKVYSKSHISFNTNMTIDFISIVNKSKKLKPFEERIKEIRRVPSPSEVDIQSNIYIYNAIALSNKFTEDDLMFIRMNYEGSNHIAIIDFDQVKNDILDDNLRNVEDYIMDS